MRQSSVCCRQLCGWSNTRSTYLSAEFVVSCSILETPNILNLPPRISNNAQEEYVFCPNEPHLTVALNICFLIILYFILVGMASSSANKDGKIYYVPTQVDPLAIASKRALRQSPMRLFLQDTGVLFKMLPYLPWVFLPLRLKESSNEGTLNTKETILQGFLLVLELILLLLFLPAILFFQGLFSCFFTLSQFS